MVVPLIHTRLNVPTRRAECIDRGRLFDLLGGILTRKLCLVSAPAGFGKTTLLSSWLEKNDERAAWVSLGPEHNDLHSFIASIVASLRRLEPDSLKMLWNMLQSPQPPGKEVLLAHLINELDQLQTDLILVLDDYHRIQSEDVHEGMAFLLDNLPARLHIIVSSRQEAPFPVSNLRVQDEIIEIETQDLRFSREEAAEFLNRIMSLDLTADEIARLEEQTEGWAAGLQLAALMIRGSGKDSRIISEFSGDSRYIADYLVDEVLSKQSQEIYTFLLWTSILDKFSASLCNALTGAENSRQIIESLEHSKLFIFPLDERRIWYRYHHLFRDLLLHRLKESSPSMLADLYLRASRWYEEQRLYTDAVEHALMAGDYQRTADLIEWASESVMGQGRWRVLMDWFNQLPGGVIVSNPKLWAIYVWTLINIDLSKARRASHWLKLDQVHRLALPKDDERKVRGEIAVVRGALAIHSYGDAGRARELTREGLDILSDRNPYGQSVAALNYGYASLQMGELAEARQASEKALELSRRAGSSLVALFSMINLAAITAREGNLSLAEELYQETIQFARHFGLQEGNVFSKAYTGLSDLCYEWNRLPEAMYYLREGLRLAEKVDYLDFLIPAYIDMARLQCAQGDYDQAHETCLLAEKVTRKYKNSPVMAERVGALQAKISLLQGKPQVARHWFEQAGICVSENLCFPREFALLCAAEVLIIEKNFSAALSLLSQMLALAERQNRVRSMLQIGLMIARVHGLSGRIGAALDALEALVQQAAPEGYLRTIIDQREPVFFLLTQLIRRNQATEVWDDTTLHYAQDLARLMDPAGPSSYAGAPDRQKTFIMEPLTRRELEVLRRVTQGASNQQIADEMVVALSTVKWHLKNIYGKLGAKNRVQAIRVAKELKLLS